MLEIIEECTKWCADTLWNIPILLTTLGAGTLLFLYSRFTPFRYFFHAINVVRGKYDKPEDKGQINHYQALSTAIAATVGMGNIAGVALAIGMGGPGVVFWMWISALVGMCTKFFTCSLSVMYRSKKRGTIVGGPMYVIENALGKGWKPLAVLFAVAGTIGTMPSFQANQLTLVMSNILLVNNGVEKSMLSDFIIGGVFAIVVAMVIFGGVKRIANVAGKMVPTMIVIYFVMVLIILFANISSVPHYLTLIVTDAFQGNFYKGEADVFWGTALGGLIVLGARRATFSNEAGAGTAPLIHGVAKTNEPIQEGLVAMLGPFIDTLIVCTLTALAILTTGVWEGADAMEGIALTNKAFNSVFGTAGSYLLLIAISTFAISSLFSYSYFGSRCFAYLFGEQHLNYYNWFYVGMTIVGAVASVTFIVSLIDVAFALMTIPTMISTMLLAPKVRRVAKDYFARMKKHKA